jgi:hypothetical protein
MDPCNGEVRWTLPCMDIRGCAMRKSNLVLINTGERYRMEHEWDVVDDAEVEDIVGKYKIGSGSLLMVEKFSFDNESPKGLKHQGIEDNSYTWTFINL